MGAKYTIINDPKTNQMASVRASLFVQNGVNYKLKNGDADRLNALYDLSLGGEYFFSKNIGLFLDINNILDNKRERWQNLPTFGLNVLGGISARFWTVFVSSFLKNKAINAEGVYRFIF